jgi:hypothetical protein
LAGPQIRRWTPTVFERIAKPIGLAMGLTAVVGALFASAV